MSRAAANNHTVCAIKLSYDFCSIPVYDKASSANLTYLHSNNWQK